MSRIVAFFFLAFLIPWALWVPMALYRMGLFPFEVPLLIGQSIGSYGPLLAAAFISERDKLPPTIGSIFATIKRTGSTWPWLLVGLLIPPLIVVVANVAYAVAGLRPLGLLAEEPLQRQGMGLLWLIPLQFATGFMSSPIGEEPGWRGYALPLLRERMPLLPASVVLGLLWGVWHLPLLIAQGQPIRLSYVVALLGYSMIVDKLFTKARDNILVAMVFHQSLATSWIFLDGGTATSLPAETPFALITLWIVVVIVRLLP